MNKIWSVLGYISLQSILKQDNESFIKKFQDGGLSIWKKEERNREIMYNV